MQCAPRTRFVKLTVCVGACVLLQAAFYGIHHAAAWTVAPLAVLLAFAATRAGWDTPRRKVGWMAAPAAAGAAYLAYFAARLLST